MKIIIVKNPKEVGVKAAGLVFKDIKKKKNLVLGLATGRTMIPFYKNLVKVINNRETSTNNIRTFNLDEYVGLSFGDKRSLRYFMEKNFFSKVDIPEENIHFLDGKAKNLDLECTKYEREIKNAGGIDLQILGIGRDGHIGFNEPNSSFNSKTREIVLKEITRKDNSRYFSSLKKFPQKALTMGVGTIMSAKKIILLAFGKGKAEIIHRVLHGKVSKNFPASVLQKHRDVTFILDKGAASEFGI